MQDNPLSSDHKNDKHDNNGEFEKNTLLTPVVEQVIKETKKVITKFEDTSPSNRFLITLIGIVGIALIFASIIFGVYSFFTPEKNKSNEILELSNAFVGLTKTLNANNPKINSALFEIIKEGNSSTQLANNEVPDSHDLLGIMREEFRQSNSVTNVEELRHFIARKSWQIGIGEIRSEMLILKYFDKKRQAVRKKLNEENVGFKPTYNIDQYGFSLKKVHLDDLWLYVHLEEYEIACALFGKTLEEIEQNISLTNDDLACDLSRALEALIAILKVAEIASKQKELNLRLHAVYIRENAFDTLQTLINNPEFKVRHARKILDLLQYQLRVWPSDANAFAGDRTSGVWLYETTRSGNLLKVLSQQDVDSLQKIGELANLETKIRQHVDDDELYYLKKMQRVMQLCREPYYNRLKEITLIENELESMRGTGSFPVLADVVLLRDLRTVMRLMAEDRARTEAWSFALMASQGISSPNILIHPIYGKPYQYNFSQELNKQEREIVSVSIFDNTDPIRIPRYTQ